MLRIVKYDRQTLAVRRLQSENMDADPIVWTNQRFIRWARSIDLGEYADNLKGNRRLCLHKIQKTRFFCSPNKPLIKFKFSVTKNDRQWRSRRISRIGAVIQWRDHGNGPRHSPIKKHHSTPSDNRI